MKKQLSILLAVAAASGLGAAAGRSDSTPVGPLPSGPTKTVSLRAGTTFTATLPKSAVSGRVWRIARAYDDAVLRELREGDSKSVVWVTFRAVASGATRVVFALTRGETSHAYAARTFRVLVAKQAASGSSACPRDLLPFAADPIGPAVTAALSGDAAKNRPQVTAAAIAPNDMQRGPEVKTRCGAEVWQRTVVVYITDRAFLPSQSASQRVLFVGRTSAGYLVWQRAH